MDDKTRFGILSKYGRMPSTENSAKQKPSGYRLVAVAGTREEVVQSALPHQYGLLVYKKKELMRQSCYASGENIKQVLKSEYRYFGTIDDVMEYIAERKEFERKLMKKSYRFPHLHGIISDDYFNEDI
jgi:hypothetical protein